MLRVIVGLIKGAIIGGGVGFLLLKLGWTSSTLIAYLACAAVGAVVGVVAGRAPWRAETIWTPVIKMIVGALVGVGLAAVGLKLVPDFSLHVKQLADFGGGDLHLHSAPLLAPIIGVLYGIFVEVDDGGAKKPSPPPASRSSS
jgi:hypothetical protein